MCKTETDVLELVRALAQALQAHHLGLTTTEPFARTYARDRGLIGQAEDFLMAAKGESQPWCLYPEVFSLISNEPEEGSLSKCEFCNAAPDTREVEVEGKPGIAARVCVRCLQEIQLGHVLKDIYGWSWTLFEGKFIAEFVEPELEPEEVADA